MRAFLFRPRSLSRSKPRRWQQRLLYFLAAWGLGSLLGLIFLLALALRVPAERLTVWQPAPLTAKLGQVELIPLPAEGLAASFQPHAGGSDNSPAYAAFYQTQSRAEDWRSDPTKTRSRAKAARRPAGAKKPRQSS